RSRQLIYFGILCSCFFVVCIKIADALPAADFWHLEDAFHAILNSSMPRIFLASIIATVVGDFVNCKIISKLKIKIKKWMWFRFISATAIGALVDITLFTLLAFAGVKPFSWIIMLLINQYIMKLSYSAMVSPLSVTVSKYLKKAEKSDVYDMFTNFSPFK